MKSPMCLLCCGICLLCRLSERYILITSCCKYRQQCLRLFLQQHHVQDRSWRTAALWNNNNSTRAEIKPHNSLAGSSSSTTTTIRILRDVVNKLCQETQIPSQICFFPWTGEVQLRPAQLLFYVCCVTSQMERFYTVSCPAGLRLVLSCQASACLLSTRPGVGRYNTSQTGDSAQNHRLNISSHKIWV